MSATPGRSSLPVAVAGVAACAAACWAFLEAESQWVVAALAAGVLAALPVLDRTGLRARFDAAVHARRALAPALVVTAAFALALVLRDSHFALLMLASVALYVTVCLGLTLQFGFAGIANFAGAAFFGIGCYSAAILAANTALPHLLAVLAGGLAAAAVGSVLILPILRTRGHYAALVTIAFGILFRTFLEVNDVLGGPQGLKVPGMRILGWSFNDPPPLPGGVEASFYLNYVIVAVALAAGAFVLVKRIESSWIGLSFDAVRLDETAAAVCGIDIARWKILAFVLGNFLAGTAGAVYAMMSGFIAPNSFTFGDSLILVSIVILGGVGNPLGVIPAALLLLILPEKLQAIQEYRFLIYAVLVILILLYRPQGLLPRRLREYSAPGPRP
ncbi:MAG TPA: branched-chain amino acid ABC transporter permease [Burkholderiales bacterium]|nr:branched-chain amino acid ABC transporter permease [Burkholderiales bacterium]